MYMYMCVGVCANIHVPYKLCSTSCLVQYITFTVAWSIMGMPKSYKILLYMYMHEIIYIYMYCTCTYMYIL